MWLATTIDFFSVVKKDCEHDRIVRGVQSGTPQLTVTDTTLSTGPIRREISWHAPFHQVRTRNAFREGVAEI